VFDAEIVSGKFLPEPARQLLGRRVPVSAFVAPRIVDDDHVSVSPGVFDDGGKLPIDRRIVLVMVRIEPKEARFFESSHQWPQDLPAVAKEQLHVRRVAEALSGSFVKAGVYLY